MTDTITPPAYSGPIPSFETAPPVASAPIPATPAVAPTGQLSATNVSCWFSGRKVLERCSLEMNPGQVTALIGPSGCGKLTFLRTLNRMHELVPRAQLAGDILLDGTDIYGSEVSPAWVRSQIGMVFQKPNPFPAMSISENILSGLKLSGQKVGDEDEVVERNLRRAGLWEEVKDRLDDGGVGLSGGQQQRLCIARALAVQPSVLLMDEPCSALDPISTGVIEETIRELCTDVTIVIVTHNMQQANRVSDNCAFFMLEEQGAPGRIVEAGETAQMFGAPRDPRTEAYVTGRFG